jgi:thiol peroxidase
MGKLDFGGKEVNTFADLPSVGSDAPEFTLTGDDFADISKSEFDGKRIILNIFPTIATPVCQASVRKFNEEASKLDNTAVLCISKDLPLALKNFCGAEGIENVVVLSDFRGKGFDEDYGVRMIDGPWYGLLARSIVVIDENGKVAHNELVPAVGQEPDYQAAIASL